MRLHPKAASGTVTKQTDIKVRVPSHVVGVHDGAAAPRVGHKEKIAVAAERVIAHCDWLGHKIAAPHGGHALVTKRRNIAGTGHDSAAVIGEIVAVDGPAASA